MKPLLTIMSLGSALEPGANNRKGSRRRDEI